MPVLMHGIITGTIHPITRELGPRPALCRSAQPRREVGPRIGYAAAPFVIRRPSRR